MIENDDILRFQVYLLVFEVAMNAPDMTTFVFFGGI
jgi:hypothetical protein